MSKESEYQREVLQETTLFFGRGLAQDRDFLSEQFAHSHIMIVTESGVPDYLLAALKKAFLGRICRVLALSESNALKTLENVEKIWSHLIDGAYPRDSLLVALGGGSISDLTGFAAACYYRGIKYISIPTTLLAQADAAIGGKTGIDFFGIKNSIGAFHAPTSIFIDPEVLLSLTERQYRAGLIEIIKHGLIAGEFFNWLEVHYTQLLNRDLPIVEQAIQRSCQIKSTIVAQDPQETQGIRVRLNLGHTFGHALERQAVCKGMLHGEAVALGLRMMARLSVQVAGLSLSVERRVGVLLDRLGMPKKLPEKLFFSDFMAALSRDKKVQSGQIFCILLTEIGQAIPYHLSDKQLVATLFKDFMS